MQPNISMKYSEKCRRNKKSFNQQDKEKIFRAIKKHER